MDAEFYKENNLTPPKHIDHGLAVDDIARRVQSINPRNWRQQGNQLIADSDVGELVNTIPPNYLLVGVENNLPKFKKL